MSSGPSGPIFGFGKNWLAALLKDAAAILGAALIAGFVP